MNERGLSNEQPGMYDDIIKQLRADGTEAEKQYITQIEEHAESYPEVRELLLEHLVTAIKEDAIAADQLSMLSLGEWIVQQERHYWEFLTIMSHAIPDLDINALYNEYVAKIDAKLDEEDMAVQEVATSSKAAMGEIAIDYRLAEPPHSDSEQQE